MSSPTPSVLERSAATGTATVESSDNVRSMRAASLTAGLALLLMAMLAGFGYMVAVDGLVTPGDATQTATDIAASRGLFGFGIGSLMAVIALDVTVAWALYRLMAPVNRSIAAVAAWLRMGYAGSFAVAITRLVQVWASVGSGTALTDQTAAQALAGLNTFNAVWDAGLVLFGLHLVAIAYLAYRSGFAPRILAVLVAIAGAGYIYDSFVQFLTSGTAPEASSFTFLGELLLAFWLVFLARRLSASSLPAAGASGR